MKKFIYQIGNALGLLKQGNEYWVNTNDIMIQDSLINKRFDEIEWHYKLSYWVEHGDFDSHIVLNHNFVLVKGYINYLIAKEYNLKSIPVIFMD